MEILKVKNLSKIYHTKDSEIIALKVSFKNIKSITEKINNYPY